MENLEFYNRVRAVPDNAKKKISGGRLKNMTDINPMWRIKTLTEVFGPVGLGWKIQIVRTWLDAGEKGEIVANAEILLFVKYAGLDGEWSEGIPGIGGSKIVAQESNGLYTSDECYKMAVTDAISVACKLIGIGADVYWDKDTTKYTISEEEPPSAPSAPVSPAEPSVTCDKCGREIKAIKKKDGTVVLAGIAKEKCGGLCPDCYRKAHLTNDKESKGE